MKTTLITSAFFALSLSAGFAGHYDHHEDDHHDDHHEGHYGSLAHQTDTKGAFLKRLAIAPTHYECRTNVHAIEDAALSAGDVRMLGKVEYEYGKSWLGHTAKHQIEDVILRNRFACNPSSLIVVLGYADRTGRCSVNFRLSENRAANVKNHIDQINWEHHLNLRTALIPMGEEVELCEHDLGHNRVAEIWLIEFPVAVKRVVTIVEPVIEHKTVETRIVQAPVQNVVTTAVQNVPRVVLQPRVVNPLQQLAEFLEHNVMLAPNADPNEFARQLSLLKGLGNNITFSN